MSIQPLIEKAKDRVESFLTQRLPDCQSSPQPFNQALHYVVFNGGKRIRPLLTYATADLLNLPWEKVDHLAVACELIHTYSLVHDDLPAMDDDDLRRGKPTCHKAFDEATAILVGDALLTLAFEVLADNEHTSFSSEATLHMCRTLAQAAGANGMVKGQALDMASTRQSLTLPELENLHLHKTGALIQASVLLPAIGHQGDDQTLISNLKTFAKSIGLAFQIQDDILDVEGDTEIIGKTVGSDMALDKSTYPKLLGLEEAKAHAKAQHDTAIAILDSFEGMNTTSLKLITDFIVQRVL